MIAPALLVIAALEWTNPITIILGIGGAAMVAGTVVAYLRAGLAKATIELQEKEIKALKDSYERMHGDLGRAQEKLVAQGTEIQYLRELATGSKVAERLEMVVAALQAERKTEHAEILARLGPLGRRGVAEAKESTGARRRSR